MQEYSQGFSIKRTRSGLGLFTRIEIKKGALVIEYTGELINDEEADRRGGKYLFTINSKWTIDGKDRSNVARYINHSCKPNCEAEVRERKRQVHIYAKRHIRAGEELTYDYGKEYWNEYIKPRGCMCEKCFSR